MEIIENQFKGHDGLVLAYRAWIAKAPVGTLLMTHGMGEHSACYQRLAQAVVPSGWSLYAWDLRGHGRSEGRKGVVSSFTDYTKDLASFIAHVGRPTVLMGHSMGGLITLRALIDHGSFGAKALALSSPLLGIAVEVPEIKKKAARILVKILPKLTMSNEIDYNDLSSDPRVIDEYNADSLRHDRTSSVLYLQIVESMEHVLKNAHKIQLPTLVQQAGNDRIVSAGESKKLFEHLGSRDKKWIIYEGYKHEIFNESGRDRVYSDLNHWLRPFATGPSA